MHSRGKVIGLSVCLSVDMKIARSQDLGLRASENAIKMSETAKN